MTDDFLSPTEVASLRAWVLKAAETEGWPESEAGQAGELLASDHPVLQALVPRLDALLGVQNTLEPFFRGRVAGPGHDHPPHLDDYEIGGARLWLTVMIYLDEVKGGRTLFEQASPPLAVEPRPGRAFAWINLTEGGRPDPAAEHAIEPIIEGTRVALTWFVYATDEEIEAARSKAARGESEEADDPTPLITELRRAEPMGRRFFCIDDGVPEETTRALYRACKAQGADFIRVRPRKVDPRRGPLEPGDLLFCPSTSLVSERVEQQLWQPGVRSFHRRAEGPFTTTLNPGLAFERAGLPVPRSITLEQAPDEALAGYVDWLGGFPVVVKVPGGEGGVGVMRADSMPALRSMVDLLLHRGPPPTLMAYVPDALHLRLIVVGDEVVTAYRNPLIEEDFRSAPSPDPEDYDVEIDEELCALALAASRVVGYAFAGVDILIDGQGALWLLEANFPCYFPQAETFGADVAGPMVAWLLG